MSCVKAIAETPHLLSIPPTYVFNISNNDDHHQHVSEHSSEEDHTIPIIDFSLLTCGTSDQRSNIIHDLAKACQDWGFFMVINHGVPEKLIKEILEACNRFFDMREEEKKEFEAKNVLDPIRYGTSFNTSVEKVFFWRDYLKVLVHPNFHFSNKPSGFSELALEYCIRTREVAMELVKAISESLGLEESYTEKALDLKSGLQIFIANLYPPCPQPDLAMGMPPHSDHGLLTLLIQNGIGGLQIQHNNKWINVEAIPNSFLVNTADHLEILSNGKYKSVMHRAIVNDKSTRVSVAMANGPSLDSIVYPAADLVDEENHPPAYRGMKYKDYLELQQSGNLQGKSVLDRVRI